MHSRAHTLFLITKIAAKKGLLLNIGPNSVQMILKYLACLEILPTLRYACLEVLPTLGLTLSVLMLAWYSYE